MEPSCSKLNIFRECCHPFVVSSIASADRLKAFSHQGALLKFALSLSVISAGVDSVFVSFSHLHASTSNLVFVRVGMLRDRILLTLSVFSPSPFLLFIL